MVKIKPTSLIIGIGKKGEIVNVKEKKAKYLVEEAGVTEYVKEKPVKKKTPKRKPKGKTTTKKEKINTGRKPKKEKDNERHEISKEIDLEISKKEIILIQKIENTKEEIELGNFSITKHGLSRWLRNNISKEMKELGFIDYKEVPQTNARIQYIFNKIKEKKKTQAEKKKLELLTPKEEIIQKFKDPKLLYNIHKELSKDHIEDDKEKMTTFVVGCSAYAKNPRDRKSISLKGDPSAGKDNMMDTVLKHFPRGHTLKLTSGTQATLEDDIKTKKIIAFSEVNAAREDGANKFLTEVIKQITEGGTSALKKDAATGYADSKHVIQEQKTVFKATTEEENEDETHTRFVEVTVQGKPEKTTKVNKNSCDQVSDLNKLFQYGERESWILQGIRSLKNYDVWMPYAKLFKQEIIDPQKRTVNIFDNSDPRSQRDVKRLLALTKAMAWLHQHQRNIIEVNGKKIILSEPVDFLNTLEITSDCFNQTYKGFDCRLQAVFDKIQELEKPIEELENKKGAARSEVQTALDIKSKNTIKIRINLLQEKGAVKWIGNAGNNLVYYACQEGVNSRSLTVSDTHLKQHLKQYSTKKELERHEILTKIEDCKTSNFDTTKAIKQNYAIEDDNLKNNKLVFSEKIDTCQIDTRQKDGDIKDFSKHPSTENIPEEVVCDE